MHTIRKKGYTRSLLVILVALLVLIPINVYAQGPNKGDKIVFGGNFVLQSDQSLDGNLIVLGGTALVEENAAINGDIAVIGGTATINGQVVGDILAFGGVIKLGNTALVTGDATAIGGVINREPGAEVKGNIVETNDREKDDKTGPGGIAPPPAPPGEFQNLPFHAVRPERGPTSWMLKMLIAGFSAIAWTAILAALGVFLILLAPKHTERVATTIRRNLILSFALGLAAVVLAVPLIIMLALTICLLPIATIVPLILLIAWLLGWVALGWILGKELLRVSNTQNVTPIWEIIAGVAILTLLWKLPRVMPFVGGLASFLVLFIAGNIAIGGALLTKFGSRSYPAAKPEIPATPAPEAISEHSSIQPTHETPRDDSSIQPPVDES